MCTHCPEDKQCEKMSSKLHEKMSSQENQPGDFPSLLCLCETPPGVLHTRLGFSTGHGPIAVSAEEGHKNCQGDEVFLLQVQAERAGVVQTGEEKAPGRAHCNLKGADKKEGEGFLIQADGHRTKGNGSKVKEGR